MYTGVTGNIIQRTYQHRKKIHKGFTNKYNVDKLVYYEIFDDPGRAIKREKTIKNLLRRKKIQLIKDKNPQFKDLYKEILSD